MIEELQTRYGTMFIPSTDSGQYEWLNETGASPEDSYIDLVCALLDERPRGVALDIGANFGCWTLPLSKHAETVIAFEPQRCCVDLIRQTIRANNLFNVGIENLAVGAEQGWVDIPQLDVERDANFGGVSLGNSEDQPDAPMAKVRMISIDQWLPALDVSFIKSDVEGSELDVLKGARRTIERCRPILFVEAIHPRTDLNQLGEYLLYLGYGVDCQGPNFLCVPT